MLVLVILVFLTFFVVPSLIAVAVGIFTRRKDPTMKGRREFKQFLTGAVFFASAAGTLLEAMNGVENGSGAPELERIAQTFGFAFAWALYLVFLAYLAYRFGHKTPFRRRTP